MNSEDITYGLYVEHIDGKRGDIMSPVFENETVRVLQGPMYAPSWNSAWTTWRVKDIKPVGT